MGSFDDDEVDVELLALLRQSLGIGVTQKQAPDTGVLKDAQRIYEDAQDVIIEYAGTIAAADVILQQMQQKKYSQKTWSAHELHPQEKNEATVNFIFTLDILNFCFWPDEGNQQYTVEFNDKEYTGYWSLVAVLQRALHEGIPITSPCFWQDEDGFTFELLEHVFRSCNGSSLSMMDKRFNMLRHAGQIVYEDFECSVISILDTAKGSAVELVNLLVDRFPLFRDEVYSGRRNLRFYKRAQIFVADLWACFEGASFGTFADIDKITMFADYRVPQMLYTLGCLRYSPSLENCIRQHEEIPPNSSWEIQLRGCSIWCVELIRQQILKVEPTANINAILIDFFLYDTAKAKEADGTMSIPHHRTKSIWY